MMEYSERITHGAINTQDNMKSDITQHAFTKFFSEVSVGGAKYTVMTSASYARRLFWLVLMLFGIGFCIFQITDRVQYYMGRPTAANIRINHVRQLRFPTVTICNENRVMKNKLMESMG